MDTVLDINAEVAAMELSRFQRFFPFRSHPFAAHVDGAKAMLLGDQTAARDKLRQAIDEGVRLIVFIGPPGIGKSIIIDNVISGAHDKYQQIKIDAATVATPNNLPRLISKIDRDTKFVRFYVDDAHNLSPDMMGEFRNFLNLLESENISSQVVLIGKQQLAELASANTFAGLSTATVVMAPMDYETLHEYMAARLNLAGLSSTQVMTSGAIQTLIRASNGSPGTLNALATGSFRNAVDMRHKKVLPADAVLAVTQPNVLPSNAYSWVRRHKKTSCALLATAACIAFVGYGVGKPWFRDAREVAAGDLQSIAGSVIDFFADHTNEESPQVVASDDSIDINPIFARRTADEDQKAAQARAQLLAKMDKEARNSTLFTEPSSERPPPVIEAKPEPDPQQTQASSVAGTAPTSVPGAAAKQPDIPSGRLVVASKGTTDAVVTPSPPPVVPRPIAPGPILSDPEPISGSNVSDDALPLPPLVPHSPPKPPAHKQTRDARTTTAAIEGAPISRAGRLPEFCGRMHPDTEAGKAYMRQVCVPQNVRGDIYFHSK
jgi:type II secretory pathway predicted ATPase ExeA